MSDGAGRGEEAWRRAGERAEPHQATGPLRELEEDGTFDEYDTLADAIELIVVGELDPESLLREIVRRFQRVLELDLCALARPSSDRRTYHVLPLLDARSDAPPAEERNVPFELGVAGRIFRSGQRRPGVEMVCPTAGEAPFEDPAIGPIGPGSALFVPLLGGAEILGVVVLAASHRRYDERDAKRAQALAVELALAITRKDAEASRLRSRGFYPLLLEHFPAPIWRSGTDTLCDYFNREWLDFTGRTLSQELGEGWTKNVHPDDLRACLEGYLEAFHSREPFVAADGHPVWLEDRVQPVLGGGRDGRVRGVTVDTTFKKQVESQLARAEKMEALGRIAGGVAHDFNNILTFILGRCDFAAERLSRADPVSRDLEHIRRAAERAASVTRQLLAFGCQQPLAPRAIELDATISRMRDVLRHVVGERIELVVSLGAERGRIWIDPVEIERILVNLAVNARDAMPEGGTLSIETANVDLDAEASGPCVRLSVKDTGIGMDDATRARIFDPYFTTKALGSGTGLGLSTVFGMVKGAHGSIEVDSCVGRGTMFAIHLPRTSEPLEPSAVVGARVDALGGVETVLLVEDEDDLRDLAREFLEMHGYHVLEATDGVDALRVSGEHGSRIDVMVTDVRMPRMDGYEVGKRLLESRPGVKVIYTSGYAGPVGDEPGVPPAAPFLRKPYTLERLMQAIRTEIDGPRPG
jgi:hypothetical protein